MRNSIRDDEMNAKLHELRTKLTTTPPTKERFDELGKAIKCQAEMKWAMDTLIANGLSVK